MVVKYINKNSCQFPFDGHKRRALKCEYLTSRVKKYRNPLVAEGEAIFTAKQHLIICECMNMFSVASSYGSIASPSQFWLPCWGALSYLSKTLFNLLTLIVPDGVYL